MLRAPSLVVSIPLLFVGCSDDEPTQPDASVPHCEATGAFANQTLANGDDVEDRTYFLYVPVSYRCDAPIALLVDFHGTAGDPAPEQAYASEDFALLAEQKNAIVVRPRSRPRPFMMGNIYQWDANPGDIERNITFTRNLVEELSARFPIDPERVFATGFSSGANMAAQFIGAPASPFRGIGPIAGGDWTRATIPPITTPLTIYLATGYRDYLWPYARKTAELAERAGLDSASIHLATGSGGHEIHGWQLDEMWAAFTNETVDVTPPDPVWTREDLVERRDVTAFAIDGGSLVAAGASGHVWRRDGAWMVERERTATDYASLCFANGRGFVGGRQTSARHENGAWTDLGAVPDYGGMLGTGWINAIDCRADGSIVVGGYWSQAISADGGATWSRFTATSRFGVEAQVAAIATSSTGATVLAGYYFIGRAAPGTTTATAAADFVHWINAVTANGTKFWAVGDGGQIWASENDGVSWFEQSSGTGEDLYAVHFADAQNGAAVGRRGTVLVTSNGGTTWTPRPGIGSIPWLGAVFVDDTQIWVGGRGGLIARTPR